MNSEVSHTAVSGIRLSRQALTDPAGKTRYDSLFRRLSPVQPGYWTYPGSPPLLAHRASFDDTAYNDSRRADRRIIKTRLMGGNVAYIDIRDLELFACAYRNENYRLTRDDTDMLELLRGEGPVNIRFIKEITGRFSKNISPVLHKLQRNSLVFEDQVDSDWDRCFYLFETEFPDINLQRYPRTEALCRILPQFIEMNVFADEKSIRSFFCFNLKDIKTALSVLLGKGIIAEAVCNNRLGYILASDLVILQKEREQQPSVFVFHRNDFLVKSQEAELKARFSSHDWDILQYILIDGEFSGAVAGKFKNGPFVLKDILLDPSANIKPGRKKEIINAVYQVNNKELSPLQRYNGTVL
ncbi:hypothetical protein K7I13_03210 [Brucepastera parasyntrophica]|uniref:hypothetical protein n=1 Tax=Brucepastera parasyntrophica TaxID=2880008 RepID=UPI00210A42D6|nr:hypothetical protein [Brucepastera parasyntrophica]ULQ60331.1 hypothetical protein K7I13_03210 [Brucepastera parasyntrophica]